MECIMSGCEHFTIRGFVAENRERDCRLNYPFPIPEHLSPEQIKYLLPPMESPKQKWWICQHCIAELISQGKAGPSAVPSFGEVNAFRPLTCLEIERAGVEGRIQLLKELEREDTRTSAICYTKDSGLLHTGKSKALFDLNEIPTPEASDDILELEAPATEEELTVDNITECRNITNLTAPVDDDQHIRNKEEPETSRMPIDSTGAGNHCPSLMIQSDDSDLIPRKRKPLKYRALSELTEQGKRDKSQNVHSNGTTEIAPTTNPQPKKPKLKKKKKIQQSRIQEKHSPVNSGGRDDPEISMLQGDLIIQSSSVKSAKRKHEVAELSSDQNESADQQSCGAGANQNKKNTSGIASEKKLTVAGKELVLRDSPISTIAEDVTMAAAQNGTVNKVNPKTKRVSVDKALGSYSDDYKLCQLKSKIMKKKIQDRPVSIKRVKLDSSSAIKKQNQNPNTMCELGTSSHKQNEMPVGKDAKVMVGAELHKKNRSDKSEGKDVNQHTVIAQQKKKDKRDIRHGSSVMKRPIGRPPKNGNESIMRKRPTGMSGMDLLSMVATEQAELTSISDADTELNDTILPIRAITKEVHAPSYRIAPLESDIFALGYDGCAEATVPADYVLIDEEGDPFKLGPEDLPLRSHRILKPIRSGNQLTQKQNSVPADQRSWQDSHSAVVY